MTLMTGWESLRELSAMQDRMNRMTRLIREGYSPEGPEEALTTTTLAPPVDIYEDEHNIILKLEVPGIDEKDIDVSIQNNTLTVHGERKIEKEEKRRTSVASSGNTEALPARSRFPAQWIRDK
jgi:HSP20 family protein